MLLIFISVRMRDEQQHRFVDTLASYCVPDAIFHRPTLSESAALIRNSKAERCRETERNSGVIFVTQPSLSDDETSSKHKSIRQQLLRAVKSSIILTSAAFAADNLLATLGLIGADPAPAEHLSGTQVDADIAYAKEVADTYIRYGMVSGRVAEVGPGGSAAVALLLLAHGCEHVDLIDRFAFGHSQSNLTRTYDEILQLLPKLRSRVQSAEDLSPSIRFEVGEQAAAEVFFRKNKDYDSIASYVVLEHLYDPIGAIEAMAGALNPGGCLVHHIDFRDHGMFTSGGHHDLTFLTIPGVIYRHMSRRRGRPNRVLSHRYRDVLDRLGLRYRVLVAHLVGVGIVDPAPYDELPTEVRKRAEQEVELIRPRLAREFRNLAVEDLAVSGVIISAYKDDELTSQRDQASKLVKAVSTL